MKIKVPILDFLYDNTHKTEYSLGKTIDENSIYFEKGRP